MSDTPWLRSELEEACLEHSNEVWMVHGADLCAGQFCTIHNMSDHSMRSFPQHWRNDRGIMERICPHGIGHPDPDEYALIMEFDDGVHGCDGCCREASDEL